MKIQGKRVRRIRLVRTPKYVVAVEVEAVYPQDDPGEACFESETVALLRDIEEHAQHEDVAWLKKRGKVYQSVEIV